VKTIRTPDDRFANLPGYPFAPHYGDVADGEGEGGTRTAAGFRVIAPDLVGFGRSDKPTERGDYTYARHVAWMSEWLLSLDLRGINLFCQDWGGLIGLRLVAAHPERFARVVAANTGLPDGGGLPPEAAAPMHALYETVPVVSVTELGERFRSKEGPPGFFFWRKYCAESPDFSVGDVMQFNGGQMSSEIRSAYEAPFPDARYVAGARQFPSLVPIFPDDPEIPANQAAWEVLAAFERPFLTSFSDGDPVTAGMHSVLQERIAGAKGVDHVTIRGAGHFLQEDKGEEVAAEMIDFIRANPVAS
jgi:haloalkane dehalogenase